VTPRWDRGDTTARWLAGALWVRYRDAAFLVDAPSGVAPLLPGEPLAGLVLTSGRIETVGGLLVLLAHLDSRRGGAGLPMHVALGEERGFALVEVWQRHWPRGFPVDVDARRPGVFDVGPFEVTTVELVGGEPAGGEVVATPVVGVRVRTPDATVVVAPSCRPGTTLERVLRGADLAVVTVASTGPVDPTWYTTRDQAAALLDRAPAGWMVGDDGALLGTFPALPGA
jgi:hypothetical protein